MRFGRFSTFFERFPVAVAFIGLGVTIAGARFVAIRDNEGIQSRADSQAQQIGRELKIGITQAFDPLHRIAAWWLLQGPPLTTDDWANDAQLFISARAGLERLVWMDPHGQPRWSVRPGGLPVDGRRTAIAPELQAALDSARQLDSTGLSPIFGPANQSMIYACVPIRLHGSLKGYIAGAYNIRELVETIFQSHLPDQYAIVITSEGRQFRVPAAAEARADDRLERRVTITVANSTWSVGVSPIRNGSRSVEQWIASFGVLASLLFYVCAAMARISRRRAQELAAVNDRLRYENQERQRAEEQVATLNRDLRRKLSEFRTLLEVLPVGIAVAEDPDCRQIWTNQTLARMLEIAEGTNISQSSPAAGSRSYKLMRNGAELPADELPMQVAARTKRPVANEYIEIVRADGVVLRTLSYSAPLFDETGNVRGVIDACVDITERKQLEDRLQQAEKYQSLALMAGGIAHDFNNLLTVIMGNAASLAMGVPERSPSGRAIADVQAAAARAAGLVSQILAFTGRFWCETKPLALSAEIEKLGPAIHALVPEGIVLQYDLEPNLPLIQGGASELQQVLEALVSNSVDALQGQEGARIEVRTTRSELSARDLHVLYPDTQLAAGPYVRLEVADNGCGIPDEVLARVFDPFFTTKFVGRGLGLSAVQGIVRAHGGAIRIDSTAGHGTRVELIFPEFAPHGALRSTTPSVFA